GLRDVEANLKQRDIKFVCKHGQPPTVALHYAKDAALLVGDMGYVRPVRTWYDHVADKAPVKYVQVESEIVVPVETTSDKQEYAARTIRTKIHKKWDDYIVELEQRNVDTSSLRYPVTGDIDVSDVDGALESLDIDRGVKPVKRFEGGENAAQKVFGNFVETHLNDYDDGRNEPSKQHHSTMSPYLHFGHISPVQLAYEVKHSRYGKPDDRDAYLEELIVRRELSKNFVWFCGDYDSFKCLPDWAKKTLDEHKDDEREHVYTRDELEHGKTHDEWWNAAMKEMRETGFMANYMRMYWGKKILEWTNTPEYAHETTLYLNNKYFLDGRDPNSYGNVAWIFGLHDRPWTERDIFGKTRYMNANGLKRKFDMQAYVEMVEGLSSGERSE
ncbi:MAG: deoxyribodipyrimidine photo-lyase, partial [Planctomycetota bacterium]